MSKIVAKPLLVGPANCTVVCGLPWRRLRDAMLARGVPRVFVGRSGCFRAEDVEAELVRAPLTDTELTGEITVAAYTDPAEELRRRLGLRRRTG